MILWLQGFQVHNFSIGLNLLPVEANKIVNNEYELFYSHHRSGLNVGFKVNKFCLHLM